MEISKIFLTKEVEREAFVEERKTNKLTGIVRVGRWAQQEMTLLTMQIIIRNE